MSTKKQGGSGSGEGADGAREEGETIEGRGSPVYGVPLWGDAVVEDEGGEVAGEAGKRLAGLAVHDFRKRAERSDAEIEALTIADIVERAKFINKNQLVDFKDFKEGRVGGQSYVQVLNTDRNRIAALDALFGKADIVDAPHLNTFRGRLVDWRGVLIDDRYPIRAVFEAMTLCGINGMSVVQTRATLKDWAMEHAVNDLTYRVDQRLDGLAWDGVERMETSLVRRFACFDTALTRRFSRYFWLSVYCRVMYPGCMAPMVLSFFGTQFAGKSYFSKVICEELLGDVGADSVPLDLAAEKNEFLRDITGTSIIANIGEMTGFSRGDLNKIKDFITRTSDKMHYKFEGNFAQNRQWVPVMDGNSYTGLQRDDTGNRRFYPIFVGQIEDKNGQPAWLEEFNADFNGFREEIWSMMAEARAWLEANGGIEGYEKYVNSVVREVMAFSKEEMRSDRGTIRDDDLDDYLIAALKIVEVSVIRPRAEGEGGRPLLHCGLWITNAAINLAYKSASRNNNMRVNHQHLKNKLAKFGAEQLMTNGARGYLFRDQFDYEAWINGIQGLDIDADVDISVAFEGSQAGVKNGGF